MPHQSTAISLTTCSFRHRLRRSDEWSRKTQRELRSTWHEPWSTMAVTAALSVSDTSTAA
eukprot:2524377-Rhodomonas_salina.2